MARQKTMNTCPCGAIVACVSNEAGEFELYDKRCQACGRHVTGFNGRTGVVNSWMTAAALSRANRWYQQQLYDAEMNEWYGRGEW